MTPFSVCVVQDGEGTLHVTLVPETDILKQLTKYKQPAMTVFIEPFVTKVEAAELFSELSACNQGQLVLLLRRKAEEKEADRERGKQ